MARDFILRRYPGQRLPYTMWCTWTVRFEYGKMKDWAQETFGEMHRISAAGSNIGLSVETEADALLFKLTFE